MVPDHLEGETDETGKRRLPIRRILPWLAIVAACAAGVLFSVRTMVAEDLGYHLAYGQRHLETGRPVDHDAFLYTLPPTDLAADSRPPPGPACWYDASGRYRFANANWLTQAVIAIAYRAGGIAGLSGLLIGLTTLLFVLLVVWSRRMEAPPAIAALVVLIVAAAGFTRLTLRPELFGYVVLAAQGCLLAGAVPITWRRIAGLVALQVIFVNLHSYFFLGVAVAGAMLVGSVLERVPAAHLRRLGLGVVAMVAACLVNPWTWRGALLPVETALFLREHALSDGPAAHPWTAMADMQRPALLESGWTTDPVAIALHGALVVVAIGVLAVIARKRWPWLIAMAGMTVVAFSAERNVAVGMLVAVPIAVAAFARSWTEPISASLAVIALSGGLAWGIVSDGIYERSRMTVRFGTGLSRVHLPVGAAEWLTGHAVRGRVWTAPSASSTIYGFVDPQPDLNMVTNTWAYPPEVMRRVLAASSSYEATPFAPTAEALGIGVVVAEPGRFAEQLAAERRWAPVHVEGRFVVLVRTDGPDAALAADITVVADPHDADASTWAARTLTSIERHEDALDLLGTAAAADPDRAWTYAELARTLQSRAGHRVRFDRSAARRDLRHAVVAMRRAASLDDDPALQESVQELENVIRSLDSSAGAAPAGRP